MFAKYMNFVRYVVFISFCFPCVTLAAEAADSRELVILNWSEYLDPELVSAFEKQHKVKVRQIYFESDDYRDNYMLETKGEGIDLIVVNGIKIRQYRQQGWIEVLTEKEVPNLRHINQKWLTTFEDVEGYAMPYFWGTMGIVYRRDLVSGDVNSWKDLFQPQEALRGKIVMVASSHDLIGMALKALGYSANSASFEELKQAEQLLLQQKPYVRDYTYISLDENSSMMKGEILMAIAYSGDAMTLMEQNENIDYVVPEEGGNFWVDYMTVSKSSGNKELAYQFIDFINQPANAARLAEYVYYATPNMAAEKLLPEEFRADTIIYPTKTVLDKSEVYTRLPPTVTRYRNEVFLRVTQ